MVRVIWVVDLVGGLVGNCAWGDRCVICVRVVRVGCEVDDCGETEQEKIPALKCVSGEEF